jgi:hypothetical protein
LCSLVSVLVISVNDFAVRFKVLAAMSMMVQLL